MGAAVFRTYGNLWKYPPFNLISRGISAVLVGASGPDMFSFEYRWDEIGRGFSSL